MKGLHDLIMEIDSPSPQVMLTILARPGRKITRVKARW